MQRFDARCRTPPVTGESEYCREARGQTRGGSFTRYQNPLSVRPESHNGSIRGVKRRGVQVPVFPIRERHCHRVSRVCSHTTHQNPSGEGGIRTLGRVNPTPVFETGPFGRSGTSPNSVLTSFCRNFGILWEPALLSIYYRLYYPAEKLPAPV